MANHLSSQPFLAFAGDAADVETLKKFAAAHSWPESCIAQGDIRAAIASLKENPSPPLLLVEIAQAGEAQAQLNALAEVCAPETKVIVIGTVNEFSFYNWLMEIGISGYLLKPLSEAALEGAYAKATAVPAPAASNKKPGKVVGVIGARGGVGSTALAINLAGVIAEGGKLSTALVDLDPQDGSIALMLDMEPSKGFREALEKPDRIDPLFIDRVMQKHGKYLSLLSSEETLQERVAAHESAADILMAELRDKFQAVVLDMPRHLNAFTRKVLSRTDEVVLVAELTLSSVRDTLRLSDVVREQTRNRSPLIVANRVGLGKHGVAAADFEKGVSAKIAYSIPFAPDIYMHVGSDIPALKSKSHAAVKPVYDLAKKLFSEAKIEVAKPEKKSGGGLFKMGARSKKEETPPAAEAK